MSSLKQRQQAAEKVISSGKKGKKPRSQASIEASRRKAERRRRNLLDRDLLRGMSARDHVKTKRSARRVAYASENNAFIAAQNKAGKAWSLADLPYPPSRKPPEPVVNVWMDWAREQGNVIHFGKGQGKKARKWRASTAEARIIGMDDRGHQLVRLPLHVAVIVTGQA